MKVGARFSPLRTSLFVSDVARRHRSADLALSSAVSMALAGAPSIACESMTLPPQSMTDMASTSLLRWAQPMHASVSARAPALEITLMSRVSLGSPDCAADDVAVRLPAQSMSRQRRVGMALLLPRALCHVGEGPGTARV